MPEYSKKVANDKPWRDTSPELDHPGTLILDFLFGCELGKCTGFSNKFCANLLQQSK